MAPPVTPARAIQAQQPRRTLDISDLIPNAKNSPPQSPSAPAPPVPTSNTPLTGGEETRLTSMTSDGIFTSAELMDMLMNPERRKGYLYIGIQRSSETSQLF
jgi:hypothetical protein